MRQSSVNCSLVASVRLIASRRLMRSLIAAIVLGDLAMGAHAETRGFVVSSFHTATYSHPGNCPRGGNGASVDIQRRVLGRLGYGKAEVNQILIEKHDSKGNSLNNLLALRGPNRTAVDPFNDPQSALDPKIELMSGAYAYGFNLDGNSATGFEDPETHEKGVDNRLIRVVGCFQQYDVTLPVRPFYEDVMWDTMVDTMPAWVISISGSSLDTDGPVRISFDRALQHLRRNSSGGALANATFTIEPNSRSHVIVNGRIRNGEISIDEGVLKLEGEAPILTVLNLRRLHLRMRAEPGGSLHGFIGGYQPWMDFFYMVSSAGELNIGLDIPGIYHAFKKEADAYPDDRTGENTAISSTYVMRAVPAYLADTSGKLLAIVGQFKPTLLPLTPTTPRSSQ